MAGRNRKLYLRPYGREVAPWVRRDWVTRSDRMMKAGTSFTSAGDEQNAVATSAPQTVLRNFGIQADHRACTRSSSKLRCRGTVPSCRSERYLTTLAVRSAFPAGG